MNLKNIAVNLLVVASLCTPASFATNLSFQLPPRDYAAGPSPFAVTVEDFNGDGIPDLAVSGAASVSILLGKGKGEFRSPVTYATGGGQPWNIVAADFNGGKLDIVTANFGSGSVSVLFGNGDGTFQAPKSMRVGVQTQSVAVGDMNNDGIPDIVVASVQSGTVSTLLSNGDGTFQSPIVYSIDNGYAGMTWIALADINGDGIWMLPVSTPMVADCRF